MFTTLLNLMGMMFLLIMTGFLLRKFGFITDAGKKSITDILLYAILPCNIIKAFTTELGTDHWNDFAILLAIAIFVQIMALFICRFMYNRMNPGKSISMQRYVPTPDSLVIRCQKVYLEIQDYYLHPFSCFLRES